jgi:hypothetical protein
VPCKIAQKKERKKRCAFSLETKFSFEPANGRDFNFRLSKIKSIANSGCCS